MPFMLRWIKDVDAHSIIIIQLLLFLNIFYVAWIFRETQPESTKNKNSHAAAMWKLTLN